MSDLGFSIIARLPDEMARARALVEQFGAQKRIQVHIQLRQVLQNGRAFITPRLWALVEERLSQALAQVWGDVLALPDITDSALDAILTRRLGALAKRLEMMFA